MKHSVGYLVLTIPLLFLVAPSHAFDKWDKTDTILAVASLLLRVEDWRQTRYIAENPDRYIETNGILREHPSKREVDIYFAAVSLLQIGVAHVLPSKWRKVWLNGFIVISGDAVIHNESIGIGIRW